MDYPRSVFCIVRRGPHLSTLLAVFLGLAIVLPARAQELTFDFNQIDFSIADHSIWGDSHSDGFEYTRSDVITNVSDSFSFGEITGSANEVIIPSISLPPPAGSTPAVTADTRTGIEVDIDMFVDRFGLDTTVGFEPGDVDASVSYDPSVVVPEMFKNVHRSLNTQSNITGTPSLSTQFDGLNVNMALDIDVGAVFTGKAALIGLGQTSSSDFLSIDGTADIVGYNKNGNNRLEVADFSTSEAVNGLRVDLEDISSSLPDTGYIIPSNPSFGDSTTTLNPDGTLTTSGSDEFLELRADLDALFSSAITGGATADVFGSRIDYDILGLSVAEFSYDLLGVDYGPNLGLKQEFTLDPGLHAELTFDREVSVLNDDGTTEDITSWEGRWDELPDIAVKDGSLVTVDVEFSPGWELRNETFLTINDEMAVRVLGVNGSIAGVSGFDEVLFEKVFKLFSDPDIADTTSIEVFDEIFTLNSLDSFFIDDAFTLAVSTTDTSWLGGDGVYSDATKWDGGAVPGDTSNVLIPDAVSPSTVTLNDDPDNTAVAHEAATVSLTAGNTLVIPHRTSLTLSRDVLANNGLIHMNPSLGNFLAALLFDASAKMTGSGEILIDGSGVARIGLGPAPSTDLALTQGVNHTIRINDADVTIGRELGTPDFDFINEGSVIVDGANSELLINVDALENTGLIQATNNAAIDIAVSDATGTNEGVMRADNGAALNFIAGEFDAASFTDDTRHGQVIATNGGAIDVFGVTFEGSDFLIDDSSLDVTNTTAFGGNQFNTIIDLENGSTMDVEDTGLRARVNVDASSTLTFSGSNDVSSTLIDSEGTVLVTDGTTTILDFVTLALPSIQPVDLNNDGVLEVQNGATLNVTTNIGNTEGETLDELVGGTWRVISTGDPTSLSLDPRFAVDDAGTPKAVSGTLRRNAATVVLSGAQASFDYFETVSENDGSITFDNGHLFTTAGNFENRDSLSVTNGSAFELGGEFTQTEGSTSIESTSDFNTAGNRVAISGGTFTVDSTSSLEDLSAAGVFSGDWRVSSSDATTTTVDLQGHPITSNTGTLEVAGNATTFDALASLQSNSGELNLAGHDLELTGGLSNTGTLDVIDGGYLLVNGDYAQSAGSLLVDSISAMEVEGAFSITGGTVTLDSVVRASEVAITGGTVNGSGNLAGDMVNDSGTLNVGNSPGTLTIFGNFTQTAGGTFEVDIDRDGSGALISDVLIVKGDASLGGALSINMAASSPFEFTELVFLEVDGTLTGMFDGLNQGDVVGVFDDTNVLINYAGGDGNDVAFIVPEPASGAMLIAMIAGVVLRRRHRRA